MGVYGAKVAKMSLLAETKIHLANRFENKIKIWFTKFIICKTLSSWGSRLVKTLRISKPINEMFFYFSGLKETQKTKNS